MVFLAGTKSYPGIVWTGGGGGGPAPPPPPPLLLDQTEARRAEKIVFWDAPPPLSNGLDDWDPPYLKVWD